MQPVPMLATTIRVVGVLKVPGPFPALVGTTNCKRIILHLDMEK